MACQERREEVEVFWIRERVGGLGELEEKGAASCEYKSANTLLAATRGFKR